MTLDELEAQFNLYGIELENIEKELLFIKEELIKLKDNLSTKPDNVVFKKTANYLNAKVTELQDKVESNTTDINLLKE